MFLKSCDKTKCFRQKMSIDLLFLDYFWLMSQVVSNKTSWWVDSCAEMCCWSCSCKGAKNGIFSFLLWAKILYIFFFNTYNWMKILQSSLISFKDYEQIKLSEFKLWGPFVIWALAFSRMGDLWSYEPWQMWLIEGDPIAAYCAHID